MGCLSHVRPSLQCVYGFNCIFNIVEAPERDHNTDQRLRREKSVSWSCAQRLYCIWHAGRGEAGGGEGVHTKGSISLVRTMGKAWVGPWLGGIQGRQFENIAPIITLQGLAGTFVSRFPCLQCLLRAPESQTLDAS